VGRIPNPRPIFGRRDEDVQRHARPPSPAPTSYFTVYRNDSNENAMRVADWLNDVPYGRPGSLAGVK
jgi:hypothetical protein